MKEFSFCQTQELITIINVYVYMHAVSNIKNKRSMSIVRFLTVQSSTCHLFILGSLHIPCPTMGTLSDCVDYKCLYGNSVVYLYKRLYFLSFPNKQTNETPLV